jgi:hypothetical protein
MTTTTTDTDVARWVSDFGRWVFGQLDDLAGLLDVPLSAPAPRRADLDIEQREVPLAGAGFVAETGVLHDSPYWLEWWTVESRGGAAVITKLAAETDPRAVGFRDYTELPWFVTPRETGTIQMTGPYVDYVCTDQHTLTVTQPVVVGSAFAGVVGVDLLAATVERLLGTDLDTATGVHVLVNRVGRVVASSDVEHVAGDLVRGLPDSAWFTSRRRSGDGDGSGWRFVACGDLPLAVLSRR